MNDLVRIQINTNETGDNHATITGCDGISHWHSRGEKDIVDAINAALALCWEMKLSVYSVERA